MKLNSTILIFCFLTFFLMSCTKNGNGYKGLYQGIYEGAQQSQEMNGDAPPPSDDRPLPTYDQYEKERKEMTGANDKETQDKQSQKAPGK